MRERGGVARVRRATNILGLSAGNIPGEVMVSSTGRRVDSRLSFGDTH